MEITLTTKTKTVHLSEEEGQTLFSMLLHATQDVAREGFGDTLRRYRTVNRKLSEIRND